MQSGHHGTQMEHLQPRGNAIIPHLSVVVTIVWEMIRIGRHAQEKLASSILNLLCRMSQHMSNKL